MSQPFERRAAADIDDALDAIGRLLRRQPTQHQTELRLSIAKRHEGFERTNLQRHVGDGDDRICGAVEKTAGQADDVSRQHEVDDLPLAVAQQLVARGKAVLDEAKFAEIVAIHHEIAPLTDRQFGLNHGTQALQLRKRQVGEVSNPGQKGIVAPNVFGRVSGPRGWERS